MFYYGADYYPEHWPETRWAEDARLMQDACINVVRLAEFAWGKLEPSEGQYDFTWLDRAIETLATCEIKIVLGTPTASPPPWLVAMRPDLLLVRAEGVRATYGSRRNYCPTNPGYRQYSARIAEVMAQHYMAHPHVIGWQIDNEFGGRCYCPNCHREFHRWLEQKYGALEELNRQWGTVFWSHTYTDWSQISLPWITSGIPNPGLALDYYRFMSDSYVAFQQVQVDILRRECSHHFITHNLMGFRFDELNYFELARSLDVVSWDNYPRGFWNIADQVSFSELALGHDTMRGLKGRNFWVMEAQSGPAGWEVMGVRPRPGELRLWAYQGIAHGADAIVYFRWRSYRYGSEQYWHGILDHDGRPRRRYDEVKGMGRELERIGPLIVGSEARPEAAMILSYDSRFAFQIQPNNPGFSYGEHFASYHRALIEQNIPVNIVSPLDDLSSYKLVIAPALHVMNEAIADQLRQFVANGGVLVVTTRSGVKEDSNAVVDRPLPGLLTELCGVEIYEYDSLPVGQSMQVDSNAAGNGVKGKATVWYDVLIPRGAETVAHFNQGHNAGRAAVTLHRLEKGCVMYVGTIGDREVVNTTLAQAKDLADIESLLPPAANVEVTARWKDEQRLLFILNHSDREQCIPLNQTYHDLISGLSTTCEVHVPPKDLRILVKP